MDRIYKSAERAIVWLGSEDDNGLLAMDLIERIAETPASAADITQIEHEALLSWSRRAYWTRCWVVQEFLLARDIVVVLGARRMKWSTLSRFMHHIQGISAQSIVWQTIVGSPAYTLMQQRTVDSRPEEPLAKLLVQNQHTECEVSRDKVYAMLGLALPSEHGYVIRPSYTKDLRRLIFDVLDYCQISAKDAIRYARFLYDLLDIANDQDAMASLG